MDHRQDYPERDELRAKFTRWLETIIKRAKIDYLRKYENRPEIISYEDIPEAELLDLAQCESLFNKAKLGLNDGATFGTGGTGFMRMNIACPRSTVEQALEQLEKAVNAL